MERIHELSRSDRRVRFALLLVGVAGVVLLVDGALRGEMRHRWVGVVFGVVLLAPAVSVLLLGVRTLLLWKRVALATGALVCTLALLEAAIRAFDLRAFSMPELQTDPVLGHVYRPGRGGIDAWGFQNESVPARADVVCLGDSQTFGTNLRRIDAYPRILAERSGLAVYSMSLGGYGPIQYLALIERAASLHPRVITVGFFFGNDLSDASRFPGLERWAFLRDPELDYPVPDDVHHGDPRSLNLSMLLLDGLLSRSRLIGSLAHDLKLELKVNRHLADIYWQEGQSHSYPKGEIRTLFAPAYRLGSVDLARADVRDGLRITATCLREMSAACRAREIELVLLLIHTKEFYYQRLLASRGEPEAVALAELARAEQEVTSRVLEIAGDHSLKVVDPTPEVLASLAADAPLWPQGVDGHISREGCRLFADVLWREISSSFGRVASPR